MITVIGTFLLSMATHIILFGIFKLRVFTHIKCARSRKEAILPSVLPKLETRISMVLGSYEHNNEGFSGSSEKF